MSTDRKNNLKPKNGPKTQTPSTSPQSHISHNSHPSHSSLSSPAPPRDKRRRILDAALELFNERGFHGTPMPMVAERAGVAAGTIYRYFDSKEALVNAVFLQWQSVFNTDMFGEEWDHLPLRERFHIYWHQLAEFAFKHPKAYAFMNLHFHSSYLDDQSRAEIAKHWSRGEAFFAETREQQVTKDLPPEMLMLMIDGLFTGMFRSHVLGMVKMTPELIRAGEECAWAMVRR